MSIFNRKGKPSVKAMADFMRRFAKLIFYNERQTALCKEKSRRPAVKKSIANILTCCKSNEMKYRATRRCVARQSSVCGSGHSLARVPPLFPSAPAAGAFCANPAGGRGLPGAGAGYSQVVHMVIPSGCG
jgi:hypothetical protein